MNHDRKKKCSADKRERGTERENKGEPGRGGKRRLRTQIEKIYREKVNWKGELARKNERGRTKTKE